MFTLADIRNIAVQIEKNGEDTYRQAANLAADPELAQIFRWMADEEKHHGEMFAAIIDNRALTTAQAELEAMGSSMLQDIVRSQTFSLDQKKLEQVTGLEEVLAQSIEFETDTIEFYEFLLGFLDDQEAIAQLNNIIEQERGHVQKLEQMKKNARLHVARESKR